MHCALRHRKVDVDVVGDEAERLGPEGAEEAAVGEEVVFEVVLLEDRDEDREHAELARVGALVLGWVREAKGVGKEMVPDSS